MSSAAPQSLSRSCSMPAMVRSSTGQPMVYSTRRPRLPCVGGGVQRGQVVDDVVGGARAVDADQHVGAPRGGDLGERGVQHREVIGGGERAGIARALHHRQRVPDVGAPAGQRVKPEPALVGARRLGLGAGGLDQGGVQPDDQHRPWPATGLGGGSGQVLAGDRHRGQLPVPGHDRRPRRGPRRGGGPGQPPPGQPVAAQPLGQLVQRPQHRGVRCPTARDRRSPPGRSSPRCRTGSVAPAANAHAASTSARPRCRSGMNPARATTPARPVVRPSRSANNRGSTTPAWATVPAPPTSTVSPCDQASAGSPTSGRVLVVFT